MKSNRGIGIAETVIGLGIAGLVVFLVVKVSRSGATSRASFTRKRSLEKDAAFALKQITQTGRIAKSCTRQSATSPAFVALECDVDFDPIPKGVLTKVRFVKEAAQDKLRYEKWIGGVWDSQYEFGDATAKVTTFEVCDQAMMQSTPTCSIGSTAIGLRYAAVVAALPDRANRFFRVKIGWEEKQGTLVLQTAFFTRQSSALGALAYRWGSLE